MIFNVLLPAAVEPRNSTVRLLGIKLGLDTDRDLTALTDINNLNKYKQTKHKNDKQLKSFSINCSKYSINKKQYLTNSYNITI